LNLKKIGILPLKGMLRVFLNFLFAKIASFSFSNPITMNPARMVGWVTIMM
jgi:hypothetical protein